MLPLNVSITVQDVAAALGREITEPTEMSQVNHWIAKTLAIIQGRLGDLTKLDADVLRLVVADVVARMARNPEGKQNERIDDYSYGLSSVSASGEITLTEQEWQLLTPRVEAGAFQISISAKPGYRP